MSEELNIKITGDPAGFKQAVDVVKDSAKGAQESLNETAEAGKNIFASLGLEKISEIAGETFHKITETISGSVEAYAEEEDAVRRLTNALQNQGIFSEETLKNYREQAEAVSDLTGIQADEITKSQAVIQGFIGQREVSGDLTKAIADLAVQQGISLPQAATELGKAIGNGTGMLLRQGLQFAATDTEADRYAKTLQFVQVKAGGFAESANQGLGSIKGLHTAFAEARAELGSKFAPAVELVVGAMTTLVKPSKDGTGELANLKASVLVAGAAITGIAVILPIAGQALLVFKSIITAFNLELTATQVALAGLGIGLVIIALTELYLHWDKVSAAIKVVVKGLVTFVSEAFGGLGNVLSGAMHLNLDVVKQGLTQIQRAFGDGIDAAKEEAVKKTVATGKAQLAVKKQLADEEAKQRNELENFRSSLAKAENEAILLELNNASKAQIDLKKKEIEILKGLQNQKNANEKQLLLRQLAEIQDIETKQQQKDAVRNAQFAKIEESAQKKLNLDMITFNQDFDKKELAAIKAKLQTEQEVQTKAYADELQAEIDADNKFLEEKNKYNVAYAAINQAMHTNEVQGFSQATSELVNLTQSKNETLKDIGKAASIAQISIKTAEAAMNIYAGFATIPIVGQALGIAGAIAAGIFGAEQISNVLGANQGGIVTGGIAGQDSVPALLTPGELITPAKNFDEVVNSVAASRANQITPTSAGEAHVVLSLKDDLMKYIDLQLVKRKNLKLSFQPG